MPRFDNRSRAKEDKRGVHRSAIGRRAKYMREEKNDSEDKGRSFYRGGYKDKETRAELNSRLRREIENEKKASVIGKKAVSQHTEQPSPAQVILMKELIQKKSRFREQFIQINIDLSSKRNVLTTAIAKVELAEARQREANIEYENILKEKIRLNDEFNDICKELARIESRFPGLGASSYSNEGTTDRDQGDANGDTQESAGAKGQERCDKGTKMGVDEGDGAMDVLDLEEVGYSL